jgi:hypothetical protein
MSGDAVCAFCHGSMTRASAKCTALRVASSPTNPTGAVTLETAPADALFCSGRCLSAALAAGRARATCGVCGRSWNRQPGEPGGDRPGPGRPPAYCSASCRKVHERDIAKALRDLARDRDPVKIDAVEAALALALTLAKHWDTTAGPAALRPPSPRARVALANRIHRLSERREQLLDEMEAKRQTEAWQAANEEAALRRALEEAEEAAWRQQALDA